MSLLMFESTEREPSATSGQKWTNIWSTNIGGTTDSRSEWQMGQDNSPSFYKDLGADEASTMIAGFRFHLPNDETLTNDYFMGFWGDNGSVLHVSLVFTTNRQINVYRGAPATNLIASSSTNAFSNNQWTYCECKTFINDSTGTVQVRIDGQDIINATGLDTKNAGSDALIDRVSFGSSEANTSFNGTDYVILNTSGSAPLNDLIGPATVYAKAPTGAGNYTQWTPNTGANWAAVDENIGTPANGPDGDTTYVESTADGDRDSYVYADITEVSSGILAVQVVPSVRYNVSPLNIGTFVRRSSTDSDGNTLTPTASYSDRGYTIWTQDPIAASDWTVSNFNASEFGIFSEAP